MSKVISAKPYECACCHRVEAEGTVTVNSGHLLRLCLPTAWVTKARYLDDHQLVSFVCAECNSKGLSP